MHGGRTWGCLSCDEQRVLWLQVPYGKFLREPAVWAVITAHFCFNWGYYTLLSWLPSYFDLALGLQVSQSSILTLIPYLAMVIMTPFVGPTADGLIAGGMSVTRVRKLCQGVSFIGPAICMLALSALTPVAGGGDGLAVWGVVGIMSLAFALSAWARAGLYCNHQDMSPKYASKRTPFHRRFGETE
jgi:MFS transporter, ACS family, solute carrier family 17 (sodium-dependent inorganic phosphate cotransporter), other